VSVDVSTPAGEPGYGSFEVDEQGTHERNA
jgi:hypothetical protein